MERFCGMLLPLAHSRLHPYVNLANNILLQERFNHLHYKKNIHEQVFPTKSIRQQYNEKMVFSTEEYEEEVYFPSVRHHLNKSSMKKLQLHYNDAYGILKTN